MTNSLGERLWTGEEIVSGVKEDRSFLDQVLNFYCSKIKKEGPEINCFTFFSESALAQQQSVLRQRIEAKEDLPLAGLPVSVKDNIAVEGMPLTCASKILENYYPSYSATAVERLVKAGAIIIGKTNLDEFAMGSSSEYSYFGPVKNPRDKRKVSGGSSGGSAASVAGGFCPVALGSDTGGSVRQPASFCGVLGLKPSYGRGSRYGLTAFGSSLDQIGVFANNSRDLSLILNAVSGQDKKDSTSSALPPFSAEKHESLQPEKLKVGILQDFLKPASADVIESFAKAEEFFKNQGAQVQDVFFPELQYSVPAYYIIATAEASSNLSRYDGARYGFRSKGRLNSLGEMYKQSRSQGFGEEVTRRIILGAFVLSEGYSDKYYQKATKVRKLLLSGINKLFDKYDILLSPTTPTTAFDLGSHGQDPVSMYSSDVCTVLANLTGVPSLSVPCGVSEKTKMPVGLQIIANRNQEQKLMSVSSFFQQGFC